MSCFRSRLIGLAIVVLVGAVQHSPAAAQRATQKSPPDTRQVITRHQIAVAGRELAYTAIAGWIPLAGSNGRAEADTAFTAFLAESADPTRPVTFVMNGGPGAASAYLNLGALGPWRVTLDPNPSARPPVLPNPESWLAFTDLVFLDPPGTGLGRILRPTARERLWSTKGDVEALAAVIVRWLQTHHRLASPTVLLGQSYGGFRAPRVAGQLRRQHGVGISGLVLLSPQLDYGWDVHARTSPLPFATLLPSMAAARLDKEGRLTTAELRAIEDYARGEFVTDFLRGPADAEAVDRIVNRVAAISGLPAAVVRASRGRIDAETFQREIARERGSVASSYDIAVVKPVTDATRPTADFADPFLESIKAPLTAAMAALLQDKLQVKVSRPYELTSDEVFTSWNWGTDGELPEAVSALREMLALDESLAVLVAHGYADLETPYFQTHLILDQLGDHGRILRRTYPGGHMFYSRDSSRVAFRADAQQFYQALTKP